MVDPISDKLTKYCDKNNIELTDENFLYVLEEAITKEEYETCFLTEEIASQLDDFADHGDELFEQGAIQEAIEVFENGIALIPYPKIEYEATLWFTTALADCFWYLREYEKAHHYLDLSMDIFTGQRNPFVRLRLGQVLYELGLMEKAKEELLVGLEISGKDLFEGEDLKYLEHALK